MFNNQTLCPGTNTAKSALLKNLDTYMLSLPTVDGFNCIHGSTLDVSTCDTAVIASGCNVQPTITMNANSTTSANSQAPIGAIVGGSVAALIVVIAAISIGVLILRRRQKHHQLQTKQSSESHTSTLKKTVVIAGESDSTIEKSYLNYQTKNEEEIAEII
ncbi:hypothetical protein HK098_000756 [Nowakowskiella sp. JEL0407]|nr:hypothetical protein HK098_000756 [Nowakowskiella sp. JEL0407]